MKKLISLLVVLAMLMAMAPVVFAATESGGFMLEGGQSYDWTPEFSGTATLSGDPSVNIMVDGGNTAMGYTPTFEVTEGNTYAVQHFGTGFAWIAWEIVTAGGSGSGLADNQFLIESYGWSEWTAPEDGTVRLTYDVDTTMTIDIGWDNYASNVASGDTIDVTAGTTYTLVPAYGTPNCIVTWEYVSGGSGSGNQGGGQVVDTVLELGDNAIALASGDADGETFTFTATEAGTLNIAFTALSYDQGSGMEPVPEQYLNMPFTGTFVFMVNNIQVYEATTSIAVQVNDTVTVQLYCPMMRYATEGTLNLAMNSGSPGGGSQNPGDLFAGSGAVDDPYIIDSLVSPATIIVGDGGDVYYMYQATEAGTIEISDATTDAVCYLESDGWGNGTSIDVNANDVVMFNIWSTNPTVGGSAVVSFQAGSGSGSGGGNSGGSNVPDGTQGNEFIIDTLDGGYTVNAGPSIDIWDVYYMYEVEQTGTIECTSDVGGSFYFSINDPDGYDWGNPATSVDVTANDVLYINYYNTTVNDISGTIAYAQGSGSVPAGGATAAEGENFTEIFEATQDGTLTITVGDGSCGWGSNVYDWNAWEIIPGITGTEEDSYSIPVVADNKYTVRIFGAGDPSAAISNVPYSIVFTPNGGSGGSEINGDEVVSDTNVSVPTDEPLEIPYTPDENGILTVVISGDPGYQVKVYPTNNPEGTVGLPKTGNTEKELTYELQAGVNYTVCIEGYDTNEWSTADSTINYAVYFDAAELTPDMEDKLKSETVLELGENSVDLLENAYTTLYDFTPSEPGVYTITVTGDVTMASYGFAAFNLIDEAEDGVLVHTATDADQTILIGLTGAGSAVIEIEKTDDYEAPDEVTKIPYEPTVTVDEGFVMPSGTVNSVDITEEHFAVLGNDGYYHLDSYDGPILYAVLNSNAFALANIYSGIGTPIQFLGESFIGEDGKPYAYDYLPMMSGDYYTASLFEDYYPLNLDLMLFLQDYGDAQAWYDPDKSSFDEIKAGDFNELTAWMVSVVYIENNNGTATEVAEVETKVEITEGGITVLPDSLSNAGFQSVADVNEALIEALLGANAQNTETSTAHYDVTLVYKYGKYWIAADDTHFPENGKLTVVIPYPEGTNKDYTFTVAHMFTSNAFGKTPGKIELPNVTNTEEGIKFEVTGLSPISVAWVAPAGTGTGTGTGSGAGNAQTGDPFVVAAAVALGVSTICGTALISKKKKEF